MKKIKFVNPFFTLGGRSLLFIAGLFIATSTHAGILNADFSNGADGLDDWMGDIVIDDGFGGISGDFGDITGTYPTLFSTSGGAATIQTAQVGGGPDEAFIVTLFQEFMLDPISAGASLFFSVDFSVAADDFFVELFNIDTAAVISLTSGSEVDLTSWVGDLVSLEFTVADTDLQLGDSMTISNIQFIERQSIPEPATYALLLFFTLFLIRNTRLTK